MGQVLHGSATTTAAIRRAIQHSQESLRALAKRYGVNPKTVAKWRSRSSVADLRPGPRTPRSTVLSLEDEAVIVAFRRHTLLPLDDCLYALQATIPHLTRSSLHRCLQRHGISRLPEAEGAKPRPEQVQEPIRSATSTSTSRRSAPRKASSTCSSPSTAPPSSPLPSCMRRRPGASPPTSCGADQGRALQDPHRSHRQRHPLHHARQHRLSRSRDQGRRWSAASSSAPTPSSSPAPRTTSIIA